MNQKKDYVLRWIPKYSIIPLITALILNTLIYSGTMVLCKGLAMLLLGKKSIRDVILFPAMRPLKSENAPQSANLNENSSKTKEK